MISISKEKEFSKENDYIIYELYNDNNDLYYLCIPDNNSVDYDMFIGFPKIDLSIINKDEIIKEIKEMADIIISPNRNNIYLLPSINPDNLKIAINTNDGVLYNNILKQIHSTIKNAYNLIRSNTLTTIDEDRTIDVISQTSEDEIYTNWLETNLSKYIHHVKLANLKLQYPHNEVLPDNFNNSDISLNNISQEENIRVNSGFSNIMFISIVLTLSIIISVFTVAYLYIS